jgi:hypothetical protein
MEACGVFLIIFVILFAILGVIYGLLAATMAIQRIWQRHYHILTKRVLTKEYIVEDLHGHYEPPTLDAEHADRLRSLNLLWNHVSTSSLLVKWWNKSIVGKYNSIIHKNKKVA